jgi:hypothetical protein
MSILIGLHIKKVLEQNQDVVRRVGNRIYPLVIPQGVETYPFICYDMSGGTGEQTKDGVLDDVATVNIAVIAKTYEEAIIIGNAVRYSLEGSEAEYERFAVTECSNVTYNDEYVEALDAYSVNISIDFRTIDF